MSQRVFPLALILVALISTLSLAQEPPWIQRTLLPPEIMDEIIGEASGETAWNSVVAMGGFNRDRLSEEYAGTFQEAEYILSQLKLYGLPGARIDRFTPGDSMFGGGGTTWDGIKGELWELKPLHRKIASYQDLRAMLATGSSSADVTAELVWIGYGSEEEIKRADVAGKIVVTEGSISNVHRIACQQLGAEGVVAISNSRPYIDPQEIPWRGISGRGSSDQPSKFGFFLPFREGYFLKERLLSGEKITVHAVVEAKMEPYELQCPTCFIPGTEAEAGEIIFTAHLFEGYAKQGANDNFSGSACILEVARVLHKLIEEGRIPRPKRTIRFLWVPEFSGTIPWVNANKELMESTLCNINMDMVGEWITKNRGYAVLSRTTYGCPHYVNDVLENYYRFIGECNRDQWPAGIPRPILAPSGSDDPFYYNIETHTGGSDHEVFNDWAVRVPGVSMNVWPDQWYHTSGDRPDKSDPTQLKRMAIIGAAGAYTIACADDDMAMRIADETAGNATRRLGIQLAVGLETLNGSSADTLADDYKTARAYVEAAVVNEKETLSSVLELTVDKKAAGDYLAALQGSIDDVAGSQLRVLETRMQAVCGRLGAKPVTLELSELEKTAAGIVYRPTSKVKELGPFGSMRLIRELPREERAKRPFDRSSISNTDEVNRLVNGKRNVLEIKKMLDGQYQQKSDLQAILNYLEVLELAGLVEQVSP